MLFLAAVDIDCDPLGEPLAEAAARLDLARFAGFAGEGGAVLPFTSRLQSHANRPLLDHERAERKQRGGRTAKHSL